MRIGNASGQHKVTPRVMNLSPDREQVRLAGWLTQSQVDAQEKTIIRM